MIHFRKIKKHRKHAYIIDSINFFQTLLGFQGIHSDVFKSFLKSHVNEFYSRAAA